MDIKKIYVTGKGLITIICPECGHTREIKVDPEKIPHAPLKVKCPDNHVFAIRIEMRYHIRKPVHIRAQCYHPKTRAHANVTINDLSMKGLRFESSGEPLFLAVDDTVEITFCLEDKEHTRLLKKAVVKNVQGQSFGVEFSDSWYDKVIGFYLQD